MRGNKYQGKLCKKCQTTERYLINKKCVNCTVKHSQNYRDKNPDKIKERNKKDSKKKLKWAEENKSKRKESLSKYYKANKEKLNEYGKKQYQKTKHILKVKKKIYNQEHKEERNANTRKRQASKMKRLPKWADTKAIKEFYKNRPEGMHVDHIIPLQGELVSGLHILENLQYLIPDENVAKGNKFEPLFIKSI